MLRIALKADRAVHAGLKHCAAKRGWLQKLAHLDASTAARRVFDGGREDGAVATLDPATEAELARLLPWLPRAAVRAAPSVCVYGSDRGRWLFLDVWNDALRADALEVAEVARSALAAGNPCAAWHLHTLDAPMTARSGPSTAYRVARFATAAAVPVMRREDFDVGFARLVYQGLVASALRQADPLRLLEILPGPDRLGIYVDRVPNLVEGTASARRAVYRECVFSMDLVVGGAWRLGACALFGLGEVRADGDASPTARAHTASRKPDNCRSVV